MYINQVKNSFFLHYNNIKLCTDNSVSKFNYITFFNKIRKAILQIILCKYKLG